jgi:spore coat protein A, manganese oxidase
MQSQRGIGFLEAGEQTSGNNKFRRDSEIMRLTRRDFVKTTAIGAAGILAYKAALRQAYAINNSDRLVKWIQNLRGLTALGDPNGIPVLNGVVDPAFANTTLYRVTAGEFTDQLHPQLLPTKLWGYWDTTNPVKRHLGGVILTPRNQAARIRFTNTLPAQHIIPVDTTLPGANQAQNRIAIHLHGGFIPWISDGGPFDWWMPSGASGLSFLNGPNGVLNNIPGDLMLPGQADYFYPNDQSTRLMWYHDHAHGITRLNAYAGLATGYLILDAVNAGYVAAGKIPDTASTIPLVFQDKIFVSTTTPVTDPTWATVARADVQSVGSLWYEHIYNPKEFRLLKSTKNLTPPDPSCIPEFFGDTMLANGLVYPLATLEAKRYRFLVLNACNARFLNINLLEVAPGAGEVPTDPKTGFAAAGTPLGPPIIQIGTEGGFLVSETSFLNGLPFNPATLTGNLLLAPAERADVIIDFTGLAGKEFMMYNDAPGPFPAGPPTTDYYLGNPANPVQPAPGTGPDTRNILRIKVVAAAIPDPQPTGPILNPALLDPAPIAPITTTVAPIPPLVAPAGTPVRNLTLNEAFDLYGRLTQLIGTTTPAVAGTAKGMGAVAYGLEYLAPTTEQVAAGSTEVWRIFNLSADTHPIHFHLVNVQVLSRQPFKLVSGVFTPTGVARGPEANELGWKETVQMHPGEITTVIMKFDLPATPFVVPPSPRTGSNEYVYHCHILEHEEHDMMRPLVVV